MVQSMLKVELTDPVNFLYPIVTLGALAQCIVFRFEF